MQQTRYSLLTGLLLWLLPILGRAQTQTFFYNNGRTQTYIVPANVTRLQVVAIGAAGGGYSGFGSTSGAQVQATVPVTPGEVLTIAVGGKGASGSGVSQGTPIGGGSNGGGNGRAPSGGGGGATDLRRANRTDDYLATRNALVVAGGGGGGAGSGYGGSPVGSGGSDNAGSRGGGGATQTAPGTAGSDGATAGSDNMGGAGGAPNGGGGGGGYYGGGGGGANGSGGGGGGSSWVTSSATNVIYGISSDAGFGSLAITPFTLPTPPTLLSLNPTSGPAGTRVMITGSGFTSDSRIAFNGTAALATSVLSATSITATVPGGATSGDVTVTTALGTSNGLAFTVVTATPMLGSPADGSFVRTNRPEYRGITMAGSLVYIYRAVGSGTPVLTDTTFANPLGNFHKFSNSALAEGQYQVYVTATADGRTTSANSNTVAFTVDTTPPTVMLSSNAATNGGTTSTSPVPFTASFSEPVTGFSSAGILVSNGTLSSGPTAGSGNSYSFSVLPTTPGTATTVVVAATAAQDQAGNTSVVSNSYTLTYQAPVMATSWTGAVSSDWFAAGNWSQGVPTASVDATVPGVPTGNRFPTIGSGAAVTKNLTLSDGSILTQTGGTLMVAGNWTNNGTLAASGGTITLGSAAPTGLTGSGTTRFWNLSIGAGGAQLLTSAGARVQRVLTLTGDLATNGNTFTLESSAAGTALVVNNGSSQVVGTATVQRYIGPSLNAGLGYRHYSTPVRSSTVADLATTATGGRFTPVVNPAYNSAATPTATDPFPTVYGYDDSRLSLTNDLNSFDKGFFSPQRLTDPLAVGRGYTVNLGASELVDFQGTLMTGDLSLPLTSIRPTHPDGGWQLLGNPYPAPLDYALVGKADRAGLEGAIYVYYSTGPYMGQYRSYVNGFGNPVVPVGQAFFARVAAGQYKATLTFRNSQRLTAFDTTPLQRPTADTRPAVRLTLQGASSPLLDEALVYFEAGAGSNFDPAFDAEKLPNPTGLNLATSLASGRQLSIDGQPELSAGTRVVPLAVGVPAAGRYVLAASQLLHLGAVPMYLHDRQLDTFINLHQQPSYSFTVATPTLALSRFELVFSPQQPLATVPPALAQQVSIYPNPAQTSVVLAMPTALGRQPATAALLDALGRVVRQQELPAGLASHTLPLDGMAKGLYSLRLTTEAGVLVKKLAIE